MLKIVLVLKIVNLMNWAYIRVLLCYLYINLNTIFLYRFENNQYKVSVLWLPMGVWYVRIFRNSFCPNPSRAEPQSRKGVLGRNPNHSCHFSICKTYEDTNQTQKTARFQFEAFFSSRNSARWSSPCPWRGAPTISWWPSTSPERSSYSSSVFPHQSSYVFLPGWFGVSPVWLSVW